MTASPAPLDPWDPGVDKASDIPVADLSTRTVTITFFADEAAQSLHLADLTLPQLATRIAHEVAVSKMELPWLKLAVFGDKRSEKNCLRTNANVLHVTGVEADYDAGEITFATAVATMREARIRALLYTSPSYAPGTKERWRVLTPLSKSHSPEHRKQFVARLNGLFGGKFGGETFTLSQAYLFGHLDEAEHEVEVLDGSFIDQRADLDAGAIFKKGSKREHDPNLNGGGRPAGNTDRRRGEAWAQAALAASTAELANASEGSRHATLLAKATRMGTMIARGWIDTHEARRALFAAAEVNGQIKKYGVGKFNDTFKDGIKFGLQEPHSDLPDSEPLGHANGDAATMGSKADKPETGSALSAKDLNTMRFAPIKYVVPGIIVEGLTLLAGKPKMGKSWLLLHAAIAVARAGYTLGDIKCTEGDVLYCALEDNLRRLQSRMTKLLGTQEWPARLFFRCEMPRLAEGGLKEIKEWIKAANHPRLVIIDTLAMVRTPKKRDESSYDADYAAVRELRDLANEHNIAIVLVHHLRKAEADDAFDTVSGTLGLTGAPDTILVLRRDGTGNIVLHGRGRDLIEIEKAITYSPDTCIWTIAGDVKDVRASNERRTILAAMREIELPASPADIAAAANMKVPNVKRLLQKMVDDGTITKGGYGQYNLTAPRAVA